MNLTDKQKKELRAHMRRGTITTSIKDIGFDKMQEFIGDKPPLPICRLADRYIHDELLNITREDQGLSPIY